MHRPTLSLFVLIGLLSGGLLGTSTVCGQLPHLGDHCGGIIPFVDDDPWFPYAYPTGPRGDGNRMAERSSPWQFYQAGCDPVYDQAVYGSTSDEWAVPRETPPQVVAATPATSDKVADDEDEYVDFPYELTYDDDYDDYEYHAEDYDTEEYDVGEYDDGDYDDEYEYTDEYEYDGDYEYEYDELDELDDVDSSSQPQVDEVASEQMSAEETAETESYDAEDAYRQYDEYYDQYDDEYDDYEDLSAAVDPAQEMADLSRPEPDSPADAGAEPAEGGASDHEDEYVDFPYELSYEDDVATGETASPWPIEDLSCHVSDIRDRVLAWICETGIEDSVARARIMIQGTAAQIASSLPRVLESVAKENESPAVVQPREVVADAVDTSSNSLGTSSLVRVRREARIRAAQLLGQIGESLQRMSRQMMVEIAREELESFQR